jgi:hypothetical protein
MITLRDTRYQGFNDGLHYASQVLQGEEKCSLD